MEDKSCEFFKVYMSSSSYKRLGFPPAVGLLLKGIVPAHCFIVDSKGQKWSIDIEFFDEFLIVVNGWEEFAVHHHLDDGDFLTFNYNGLQQFDVKVFKKYGLRKEKNHIAIAAKPPLPSTHKPCEVSARDRLCSYDNQMNPPTEGLIKVNVKTEQCESFDGGLCSREDKGCKSNGKSSETKEYEKSRSHETSDDSVFASYVTRGRRPAGRSTEVLMEKKRNLPHYEAPENPYFSVYITKPTKYLIRISKKWIMRNNVKFGEEIKLIGENKKAWRIAVSKTNIRTALSTGWGSFRDYHKLAYGDLCLFELLAPKSDTTQVLMVHIVRSKSNLEQP